MIVAIQFYAASEKIRAIRAQSNYNCTALYVLAMVLLCSDLAYSGGKMQLGDRLGVERDKRVRS